MKKIVLTTLIFIFTLVFMIGCSNNEIDLIAIEVEKMQTLNDGVTSDASLSPTSRFFNNASAPKTKTVEFEGKKYTGTYTQSCYDAYFIEAWDEYDFGDGTIGVSISDGSLMSFFSIKTQKGNKSAKECDEIATNLAQKYININDFSLEVTNDGGGYLYSYTYTRYINENKTGEQLRVIVSTDGQIELFNFSMLGAFDKAISKKGDMMQCVDAFNSEKAQKMATDAVKLSAEDGWFHEKTEEGNLVAFSDGSIGMVYKVTYAKNTPTDEKGNYVSTSLSKDIIIKRK